MRLRAVLGLTVVVALLVAAVLGLGTSSPVGSARAGTSTAPGFSLTDIYGHGITLSGLRNGSVAIIEFTSLSCAECQVVEKTLASIYAGYNSTGQTPVHILSVYTEPEFGDTISALQTYHNQHNITWTMAQDTSTLSVSQSYGVTALPTVVVVDKPGQLVYDVVGVQDTNTLQSSLNAALHGTASAISLVTVSVFGLAALAGVTTFFSPCAFPMFPGYMGLFLGLNVKAAAGTSAGTASQYKGAARRAALAGSVTAMGMILVFLIVGIALILAAHAVSGYIPYLLVIVGIALIGLGALLLTNLQYWRIVSPLQNLWYRMGGKRPEATLAADTSAGGRALYVKLFGYGMGYAAAAAGCVAPVIFSAIIAGLAVGLFDGVVNVLIFAGTAAALMIGVTILLAVAGQRYVNRLKAFTPVIKKISAAVLVVVGVYLIYFYYTAWIA